MDDPRFRGVKTIVVQSEVSLVVPYAKSQKHFFGLGQLAPFTNKRFPYSDNYNILYFVTHNQAPRNLRWQLIESFTTAHRVDFGCLP